MRFKQTDTPLLAAMLRYVNDGVIPFHTPGHKFGKGMHSTLEKLIGREALALDLALIEELDDFLALTTSFPHISNRDKFSDYLRNIY